MATFRLSLMTILLGIGISQQTEEGANLAPVNDQSLIKNIILVHGAFVDGSGWQPVFNILVKEGYHVTVVQQPLTSFESDVSAVKRMINQQDGPCILVGHSYGGAIITIAGNEQKVEGLVYIAAHAPDEGETEAGNGKKYPPAYKSLIAGSDGLDFINPQSFPADFAGGVESTQAIFMASSQVPVNDSNFHKVISDPAWRKKPSWYMVASADRIINPALERMYAKRAGSQTVEIAGASHSVFFTHPNEVADLIIKATKITR